ncbi:MAG TPA: hypothetical protein VGH57_18320 [Amycolatopsis sp.]
MVALSAPNATLGRKPGSKALAAVQKFVCQREWGVCPFGGSAAELGSAGRGHHEGAHGEAAPHASVDVRSRGEQPGEFVEVVQYHHGGRQADGGIIPVV